MQTRSLYAQLVAAGVPVDHHESDLYFKATPESHLIVERMRVGPGRCVTHISTFAHAVTGELWYEAPFMFEPWWIARTGRA